MSEATSDPATSPWLRPAPRFGMALIMILLLSIMTTGSARALSCAGPDIDRAMVKNDAIFLSHFAIPSPGGTLFMVDRWWKGEPRNFIFVRTSEFPFQWAMFFFRYEHFVIAEESRVGLSTSLCNQPFPTDVYAQSLVQLNTYPSFTGICA